MRCQTCGDVIGVYEPIVLVEPPGRRETSLTAEPELRDSAPVCHHRACADDLDEVHLPIFETVLGGITVLGSIVGTRKDLREVFELHAAGLTKVISETRPLEQVNDAIADVKAGRVAARIILEP